MGFLGAVFRCRGSGSPDRKVKIAMCVAISIADDSAKNGLTQQICDRFRGLNDFDHRVMAEIFNLSILNDRALVLLDKAMVPRKSRHAQSSIASDIQHEFCVEFVYFFFEIVASALRRGLNLEVLGYVANAHPPDMAMARVMLTKRVSSIATTCAPCFKVDALKKPRPKCKLFPARDAPPQSKIGCDPIDFDAATVETLERSLLAATKEKDQFLCILFGIIYHSHGADDLGNEKIALRQALVQANKKLATSVNETNCRTHQLAAANAEIERVTALLDSQQEQLGVANRETQRLVTLCNDQRHDIELAESEMLRASRLQRDQLADATADKERATALYADQRAKLYVTIREKRRLQDLYETN